MSAPGTQVVIQDQSLPRFNATDTATAFAVGFTEEGPLEPVVVRSLAEYVATFGDRVAYGGVYDFLDVAFREGLGRAYVQRVIGPDGDEEDDDHENATETEWAEALDKLAPELGPGQVAAPGRTTDATHLALAQHAQERNRFAILDLVDTDVVADLVDDAEAVRESEYARSAAAFHPWLVVPGPAAGTTRTVAPSAVICGEIARSQALGNTENVAAAGINGVSLYATALSQPAYVEPDRAALNDGGVNLIREIRGQIRTYGFRTLVDVENDPEWREIGGARTVMAIAAQAGEVGEDFVFAQIDGRGIKIGEFNGRLGAICLDYYNAGALYGETPEQAFHVDTGPGVNTPESIDEGRLLARIELATSPTAERVEIYILKSA